MTSTPLLSVCIPTYNRRERVRALVQRFLSTGPEVEVCVHVDGSSDGSVEALQELARDNPRLRVSVAANEGRASSLLRALGLATGVYAMLYDDDDDIDLEHFPKVLDRLRAGHPKGCCGFVYHMRGDDGRMLGRDFTHERTNFLRMRFDQGVWVDTKEIVVREVLKSGVYQHDGRARRVPTSTIWAKIALSHDVICVNETIGTKHYLAGGMTNVISRHKRQDPWPMCRANALKAWAFFRGRYTSLFHLGRSLLGASGYGAWALAQRLKIASAPGDR